MHLHALCSVRPALPAGGFIAPGCPGTAVRVAVVPFFSPLMSVMACVTAGDELPQLLRAQAGVLGADPAAPAPARARCGSDLMAPDPLRLPGIATGPPQQLADALERQSGGGPLADLQQLLQMVTVVPGAALLTVRAIHQPLRDVVAEPCAAAARPAGRALLTLNEPDAGSGAGSTRDSRGRVSSWRIILHHNCLLLMHINRFDIQPIRAGRA